MNFSTPLTTALPPVVMLFVGHAVAHLLQTWQKSVTPRSMGSSVTSGMSVRIGDPRCTRAPKCSVMSMPWRPISPSPAASATGMGVATRWTTE